MNAPRATYRGTYGGRACTYTEQGNTARGTHWMQYDTDPGIGPMGFATSPRPEHIGEPVTRCPACGVPAHLSAWPCDLPHGERAEAAPITHATVVATIALGTVTPTQLEQAIRDALYILGTPLIPCGWAPDMDTVADCTDVDYSALVLVDLNPAQDIRVRGNVAF